MVNDAWLFLITGSCEKGVRHNSPGGHRIPPPWAHSIPVGKNTMIDCFLQIPLCEPKFKQLVTCDALATSTETRPALGGMLACREAWPAGNFLR